VGLLWLDSGGQIQRGEAWSASRERLRGIYSAFGPTSCGAPSEDLAKRLRQRGYAKKDIPQAIKGYNARRNEMMRQCGTQILMMGYVRLLPWSRCNVIQGKSKKGDTNFELYPIPGTRIATRI
jgi:hypothetical protein